MSLPADTATWTKANYQSATAADIAALTIAQVAAMLHPDWLLPAAVAGFSAAQVAAISISWAWMSAGWINALSATAIAGIPAAGIAQLSPTAFAGLNSAHLAALTATQVAALSTAQLGTLTAGQIGVLTAKQVAALSVTQLHALSAKQLGGISAKGAAGLSIAQINALGISITHLSAAAIGGLSATTVRQLSGWQLADLTAAQATGLTAAQLAVLTGVQASYLSEGQLFALGTKVQSLSAAALGGISTSKLLAIYRELSTAQIAALPAAKAAAIAVAVKQTATLQATLAASGLLADVNAVVASGTSLFGYQGVLEVLDGLGKQIGTGALTAAQFADLKTFSTAVGAVDGTGSYLFSVLHDVVAGNAFNATYTAGAASSSKLGNLAVGSSATQYEELVGKWLLGSDNPTWSTGSATTFTFTTGALYSTNGIYAADPSQGGIGDCYLIAAIVEVALDQPTLIQSMFTDNGNGTYGVRLYAPNGKATYVTVSDALPNGDWTAHTASGAQWVTLLEKAYVEYVAEFNGSANSWSSINGGWDGGLSAITGKQDTSYLGAYTASQTEWDTTIDKAVIAALGAGEEVLYASFINDKDTNGKTDLVASHMFAVVGYDQTTGDFILRNPWGQAGGSGWNGQFEHSIDQLWGGTTGTTSDSGFIVSAGNSPAGSTSVSSAAAQFVQAIVSSGAGSGAGQILPSVTMAAQSLNAATLVAGHA